MGSKPAARKRFVAMNNSEGSSSTTMICRDGSDIAMTVEDGPSEGELAESGPRAAALIELVHKARNARSSRRANNEPTATSSCRSARSQFTDRVVLPGYKPQAVQHAERELLHVTA